MFSVPAGRRRTLPVTFSTNSLRTDSAIVEHLGAIRIADDLRQALAVAQVDEDHAAVVAAAMRPAAQGDDLVDEAGVDLAAVMGTHELYPDERSRRIAAVGLVLRGHGVAGRAAAAAAPRRPWK